MYSCHLFLIFSASVRSIPFLSFIVLNFAWNVPSACLIFLKRSLVFPILLFFSISLHWSLRKAFLSLLAILWNSAFKWVYFLFSPLPFTPLLFSAVYKDSSDNHFAFLHFFFLGMVLIPASCTISQTSIRSSSDTLSVAKELVLLNCGIGEDSWVPWTARTPVHPKGNQSWMFIGRTDAEAETPILWPPDAKNQLIGKDPDAGKDWRQEGKGTTEDEMAGWHHRLNGHEFG